MRRGGGAVSELLADAEADLESGDRARDVARRYLRRADQEGVLPQFRSLCSSFDPGQADDVFTDHLLREHYRGAPGDGQGTTGPVVTLSDVEPETVRWLWPDRIPLGKLTMLDGDPGLLKSTITLDLAARLSRGAAMPDGSSPEVDGPAGTVLLTAEDGLADTVRPRLDAAGGDPARVAVVKHVPTVDGEPRLPTVEDTPELERALDTVEARLLVVDPLMAFLPADVNSHRDQDVRRALAPLAELADEAGVAVVAIRHLNKSGGSNPKYRGGGSIGLIGAARSGLLVAEDPDAPDTRRILAATKANLSEPAPSLTYRPVQADNGAVRVEWEGESEHAAHALLDAPSGEERTAREEAADVLREELRNGPVEVDDLKGTAEELGMSWRTFRRAKNQLGIEHTRDGFGGPWQWKLPNPGQDGWPTSDDGHVDDIDNGPEPQGSSGEKESNPGQRSLLAENGRKCACGALFSDDDARCDDCKERVAEMYLAMPDPDDVELMADHSEASTPRSDRSVTS